MTDIKLINFITERISGARTMSLFLEEERADDKFCLVLGNYVQSRSALVRIEFADGSKPRFEASRACKTWDDLVSLVADAKAATE